MVVDLLAEAVNAVDDGLEAVGEHGRSCRPSPLLPVGALRSEGHDPFPHDAWGDDQPVSSATAATARSISSKVLSMCGENRSPAESPPGVIAIAGRCRRHSRS